MALAWTLPEPQTETSALLGEREVSVMTGISIETLRYLWLTGSGPEYTERNGCVLCRVADVLKWQAERRACHSRLIASYDRVTS